MKSLELGQNFLQNRQTARTLVHLSGATGAMLTVDLGAGKGIIADAILEITRGPVLAIEKDPRLLRFLREKYARRSNIEIRGGDLLTVALPSEAFVFVGNIPFNVSTQLVRRWLAVENCRGGALLVERGFGLRLAGACGHNKLSTSLGAVFDIAVPVRIDAAQFHPRPRASLGLMKVSRRDAPLVPIAELERYWMFVNYLFERSRYLVGESLAPLKLKRLPHYIARTSVRDAHVGIIAVAYQAAVDQNESGLWTMLSEFNRRLPANRQALSKTGTSHFTGPSQPGKRTCRDVSGRRAFRRAWRARGG